MNNIFSWEGVNGLLVAFNLKEIQLIVQKRAADSMNKTKPTLVIYFKNGLIHEEWGNWDQISIDELQKIYQEVNNG